jgi:hypothetical protein
MDKPTKIEQANENYGQTNENVNKLTKIMNKLTKTAIRKNTG